MSRRLRDKRIEEILNQDSDYESAASGLPIEERSDSGGLSNCEEPQTNDLDDNEESGSDIQECSQRVKMNIMQDLVNQVIMEGTVVSLRHLNI
ncbi:hypothetical protein FQA39_LY19051 [Lamprigera yunnana]|nr:hypothetical protein FQA39_LY19051 [Lamprigera yunnana]